MERTVDRRHAPELDLRPLDLEELAGDHTRRFRCQPDRDRSRFVGRIAAEVARRNVLRLAGRHHVPRSLPRRAELRRQLRRQHAVPLFVGHLQQRRDRLRIAAVDDDPRAARAEFDRDSTAPAARRAGHDRDFSFESQVHCLCTNIALAYDAQTKRLCGSFNAALRLPHTGAKIMGRRCPTTCASSSTPTPVR